MKNMRKKKAEHLLSLLNYGIVFWP